VDPLIARRWSLHQRRQLRLVLHEKSLE
jgi:hypothetical protein